VTSDSLHFEGSGIAPRANHIFEIVGRICPANVIPRLAQGVSGYRTFTRRSELRSEVSSLPLNEGAFEFTVDRSRDLAALLGPGVEVSLSIGNDRDTAAAVVESD
jgi:hypothetical protein